jgi:hypothetical protein
LRASTISSASARRRASTAIVSASISDSRALRLGGDVARTTAEGYPALAPLLDEKAVP